MAAILAGGVEAEGPGRNGQGRGGDDVLCVAAMRDMGEAYARVF